MKALALLRCCTAIILCSAPVFADQPQPVDPTVQLELNAMPTVKDERARNAIVNYNDAAKAFWISKQCQVAEAPLQKEFTDNLAKFTMLMDLLFQAEFKVSREEANKHTQTIQMYALNEVSAQKFYDCGEEAHKIWLKGYVKTKRATAGIQLR